MGYEFRPAIRDKTSLLIALAGPSGGGKTWSALSLATGLAAGGKVAVIDTEARRSLHYADAFKFDHCDMEPPFRPEAYEKVIDAADKEKYAVIVIDSMSHEWAGDGGIIDWQEEELTRMAGDDYRRREAVKMAAWIKPKMGHKRMVSRLLQCRAHLIFCLRAEEKLLMTSEVDEKSGRRKTVIVPAHDRPLLERWQPICEKNFMYEQTVSFLLLPDQPGIPRPIKLQDQHKPFFPDGRHINEQCGAELAAWAAGGATRSQEAPRNEEAAKLLAEAREVATLGKDRLQAYWKGLAKAKKEIVVQIMEELKATAIRADEDAAAAERGTDADDDPFPGDIPFDEPAAAQ